MTKKTRKRDMMRKDEFLASALRRFAEDGYAATSTRDICRDVGLVPSAIYNYFPSKESVLLAIEEREMIQLQAGLDALLEASVDKPPIDRFRVALRFILKNAIVRQQAWRLMADMMRSLSGRSKAAVIDRRDRFQKTLHSLLDDAIAAGQLAAPNSHLAILYIFGIAEGMSGWYKADKSMAPNELVNAAEDFCLRALGVSPAPLPPGLHANDI